MFKVITKDTIAPASPEEVMLTKQNQKIQAIKAYRDRLQAQDKSGFNYGSLRLAKALMDNVLDPGALDRYLTELGTPEQQALKEVSRLEQELKYRAEKISRLESLNQSLIKRPPAADLQELRERNESLENRASDLVEDMSVMRNTHQNQLQKYKDLVHHLRQVIVGLSEIEEIEQEGF